LKLDDSATYIHFERACSLAQLGRKREAITALKQINEEGKPIFFDADDPDLQPLSTMPEFKAIKEKMKEAMASPNEKEEKQDEKKSEPAKPDKPANQNAGQKAKAANNAPVAWRAKFVSILWRTGMIHPL